MQISQKLVYEKLYVHGKIYVHEIAGDLSKIYFLKNSKKTCKPNNRNLNRDWIKIETSRTRVFTTFLKIQV